jgi:hypothetical protein
MPHRYLCCSCGLPAVVDRDHKRLLVKCPLHGVLVRYYAVRPPDTTARITARSAAEMLGVNLYTVHRWCREGQLVTAERSFETWTIDIDELKRLQELGQEEP